MNETISCAVKSEPKPNSSVNNSSLLILGLFFLLGAFAGTQLLKTGFCPEFLFDVPFKDSEPLEYSLLSFIRFTRFHFVILFFGSSLFGMLFVPLIFTLRGISFSITVSAVIAAFGEKGLFAAVVLLSVQILVSIPCLYLLGMDAMKLSRRIGAGVLGKRFLPYNLFFTHFIFSVPLLAAASFLENHFVRIILMRFR